MMSLFFFLQAKSQSGPVYTSQLQGDSIYVGKSILVQDTLFFNPSLADTVKRLNSLNNFIILRINEYAGKTLPDSFRVSVQLRLYYIDKNNLEDSSRVDTLALTYYKDSSYISKAVHFLQGAYSMQIRILAVTVTYASLEDVLPSLEIENRMVIDRDYKMECSTHALKALTVDTTGIADVGEINVSWIPNKVSEFYDLEWTYIDKSALDAGRYNTGGQLNASLLFKNNRNWIGTSSVF